jgi:hypothetical protein
VIGSLVSDWPCAPISDIRYFLLSSDSVRREGGCAVADVNCVQDKLSLYGGCSILFIFVLRLHRRFRISPDLSRPNCQPVVWTNINSISVSGLPAPSRYEDGVDKSWNILGFRVWHWPNASIRPSTDVHWRAPAPRRHRGSHTPTRHCSQQGSLDPCGHESRSLVALASTTL